MKHDQHEGALAAVAALGDPLRRKLYRFVSEQDHAVGRDEAAEEVGVTRSAAAFHLDRLVADGLLEAEFRRLTGRQGPGAGRPAKLYRRARAEIAVSLPARRYQRAAAVLAAAVSEATATGTPVGAVLDRVAREEGARMASTPDVLDALAGAGYEPRPADGGIVLANCPFHALVTEHPQLVCSMNLSLLDGFADALPEAGLRAELRPEEGLCCVRLEPKDP
jgi:predicted ArsR family transcriptional regulator